MKIFYPGYLYVYNRIVPILTGLFCSHEHCNSQKDLEECTWSINLDQTQNNRPGTKVYTILKNRQCVQRLAYK